MFLLVLSDNKLFWQWHVKLNVHTTYICCDWQEHLNVENIVTQYNRPKPDRAPFHLTSTAAISHDEPQFWVIEDEKRERKESNKTKIYKYHIEISSCYCSIWYFDKSEHIIEMWNFLFFS